jgi:hypothetical protein
VPVAQVVEPERLKWLFLLLCLFGNRLYQYFKAT